MIQSVRFFLLQTFSNSLTQEKVSAIESFVCFTISQKSGVVSPRNCIWQLLKKNDYFANLRKCAKWFLTKKIHFFPSYTLILWTFLSIELIPLNNGNLKWRNYHGSTTGWGFTEPISTFSLCTTRRTIDLCWVLFVSLKVLCVPSYAIPQVVYPHRMAILTTYGVIAG